jgi:hypothetical protein
MTDRKQIRRLVILAAVLEAIAFIPLVIHLLH